MGKSYREQVVIPGFADDVAKRAEQVISDMSRVYWVDVHRHTVQARVDASMSSWGEVIMVYLSEVSGETVVEVESRCKFPLQIIDWGKNKKNVQYIIQELEAS